VEEYAAASQYRNEDERVGVSNPLILYVCSLPVSSIQDVSRSGGNVAEIVERNGRCVGMPGEQRINGVIQTSIGFFIRAVRW